MNASEITCREVEAQVPLHVGGDLEAGLQAVVTRHVASCGECRALWKRAVHAREALLVAAESPVDVPALWPGVRAELERCGILAGGSTISPPAVAMAAGRDHAPAAARTVPVWVRWGGLAAAACAVFALGRLAGGPSDRSEARSGDAVVDQRTGGGQDGPVAIDSSSPSQRAGALLADGPGQASSGQAPSVQGQPGAEPGGATLAVRADEGQRIFDDYDERGKLRKLTPNERTLGEYAPYWQEPNPFRAAGTRTVNAPVSGHAILRSER